MLAADVSCNKSIGDHGARRILEITGEREREREREGRHGAVRTEREGEYSGEHDAVQIRTTQCSTVQHRTVQCSVV
jgi:hypothetical protein